MLIVAGLSIRNLQPRVWDTTSPFHVPGLSAVMVSYGEFHQWPMRRAAAMERGLRDLLGIPTGIQIYLDNGAFYFGTKADSHALDAYEEFVERAKPDWKPIPRDYIPFPSMTSDEQLACMQKTMRVNQDYQHNGYVPVVHIGTHLLEYTKGINTHESLAKKPAIALGAIVPNLLRRPRALPYIDVLKSLHHVREAFKDKQVHIFGVGGTATLHLTALLGFDSVDSSGWRNRAARGIIQLPGSGERLAVSLGRWRGRAPSADEWQRLERCRCPACRKYGSAGLKASKMHGFCCRAAHNLWVLLEENVWLTKHVNANTYLRNYKRRLDNSTYKPVIEDLIKLLKETHTIESRLPAAASSIKPRLAALGSPSCAERILRLSSVPKPRPVVRRPRAVQAQKVRAAT